MKRRDLIKSALGLGMTLVMPSLSFNARAAASPTHYWVMVNAGGGWDPTSLCDPKGDAARSDGRGPVNNYLAADIRTAGNLSYAPWGAATAPATDHIDAFFQAHFARTRVFNGIDTQTNSHDTGSRFIWSGKSDMGHPSLAAMIAASAAPNAPMAYITNGGYDFTDGLVGAARLSGSGNFNRLAYPNRADPNSDTNIYLPDSVFDEINQHDSAELATLMAAEELPSRRRAMLELQAARSGDSNLSAIVARLPGTVSSGIKGQAEMAAAAFASGLAVSANLSVGGFDTHGNHDNSHFPSLNTLMEGVNHLWAELTRQGIASQTTVVIGSDFGRTPFYNDGNGKDHWNVTSVMVMDDAIGGNRVIGNTNALFGAGRINATSLANDSGGVLITPAHVHKSLRRLAGLSGTELDRAYPIPVTEIDLFA